MGILVDMNLKGNIFQILWKLYYMFSKSLKCYLLDVILTEVSFVQFIGGIVECLSQVLPFIAT